MAEIVGAARRPLRHAGAEHEHPAAARLYESLAFYDDGPIIRT